MIPRALVAIALLCLTLRPARADDGLRCGSNLVSVGASSGEVLAKCGPPTATRQEERTWWVHGHCIHIVIDYWTYDTGPNDFVRTLSFRDGALTDVEVGSWGSKPSPTK
jgi:hypothetical protein